MRNGNSSHVFSFSFTLIEVVVVVAVLSLTATLAVTRFRGDSPARLLDSTLTDFEGFCGRVRYRAVEDGLDWVVRFDPDARRFTALRQVRREARVYRNSEDASAQSLEADVEEEEALQNSDEEDGEKRTVSSFASEAAARLVWKLPEKITFSVPDETEQEPVEDEDGGGFDLFRFFPDGACGGDTLLVFHSGETMAKTVSISKLTGRMIVKDGDSTLQNGEDSETGTVTRQKAVYGEKI